MKRMPLIIVTLALAALAGTLLVGIPDAPVAGSGPAAPATIGRTVGGPGAAPFVERGWAPTEFEDDIPNFPIRLQDVPTVDNRGRSIDARSKRDVRPAMPVSKDVMDRMREDSMRLSTAAGVQVVEEDLTRLAGTSTFIGDTIDASQSCPGCATVPPDAEIAVGPNHILVVTNVSFAVYSKTTGALLAGPTDFDSFFAGTGCTGTFDPNALYDESTDRFVLGVDGNGVRYCIAATQTASPTGAWNRYSFQTTSNRRDFFDYPHAGVGRDAIYMGANIFRGNFFREGRVWAIDKTRLYAGLSLSVVSQTTGSESTPQPVNLHGWNQGTWPAVGPHYILTDGPYNGADYGVWTWANPLIGGGTLTDTGTFNLNAATGVTAGQPIDAPQQGGSNIQANDWRGQDAEWRNGHVWTTQTIACNPGGGTVNCLRWARIDPATRAVVEAGVFASSGTHRTFGDLAANHCNDMAIGYTKTSSSMSPAIWLTGRQSGDPAGTVQAEVVCRNGDGVYTSFESVPFRWGDYTEMTVDPNGVDFWYVGEFSKPTQSNPAFTITRWGTAVCKVSFACTAP